ncbi:hypothetical protein OC835_002509 [Tilletia horrida]|nr:hypothetical protein OC835_002509 [Tilletia horrida]
MTTQQHCHTTVVVHTRNGIRGDTLPTLSNLAVLPLLCLLSTLFLLPRRTARTLRIRAALRTYDAARAHGAKEGEQRRAPSRVSVATPPFGSTLRGVTGVRVAHYLASGIAALLTLAWAASTPTLGKTLEADWHAVCAGLLFAAFLPPLMSTEAVELYVGRCAGRPEGGEEGGAAKTKGGRYYCVLTDRARTCPASASASASAPAPAPAPAPASRLQLTAFVVRTLRPYIIALLTARMGILIPLLAGWHFFQGQSQDPSSSGSLRHFMRLAMCSCATSVVGGLGMGLLAARASFRLLPR